MWKGLGAKEADKEIIRYFKEQGRVFKQDVIVHSYPHCWRTGVPLIYRALKTWFLKIDAPVTSKDGITKTLKEWMVENNQTVNWVPDHIKNGRFGKWLEGARDWNLSRNRFWGTPIPVWLSDDGDMIAVGSIEELQQLTGVKLDDLHKHFVDKLTIEKDGKVAYQEERILPTYAWRTEFTFGDAELWWPKGYGDPALYDGTITLLDEDGTVLASDTRKVGFRTIRLERSEMIKDGEGAFCFFINGERIFVRGTNWVPLDGFHSRDAKWVESTLDMVVDLNCDMIRCWGGNVYEDTPFYDRCDREGIMIWQDFSMAGIIYPQDAEFVSKVRNEIKQVVVKLRSHPSLIMWSGNNENDNSLIWTLPTFRIDPNRDVISRKMIPEVLYEFDPTRPYLPSSPYFSEEAFQNGCQRSDLPQDHLWGPRGYYKDSFYKDAAAIFVSEIGYHGSPNKESIEKMFTKDCRFPWTKDGDWNEEWMTKSVRPLPYFVEFVGRNDLMTKQIQLLFGFRPKTLDDFVLASQSTQAEAMKYFVEKFRGAKFDKTGIIWWNVRDGWPIVSDAIVDYYNSKKLAYYYLWNAQRTVCVLINDPEDGVLPLKAVNDSREPAEGKVKVTDVESGKVVYKGKFSVEANGRSLVAGLPIPEGQGVLLIEYETGGQKLRNHYLYGTAPFDFSKYQSWMAKAGIQETINDVFNSNNQ